MGNGWQRFFLLVSLGLMVIGCTDRPAATPSPTTVAGAATETPLPPTRTSIPTATVQPTATLTLAPSATPRPGADVDAWLEDVDYFRDRLARVHPDPYYRFSAAEYDAAIAEFRDNLANMTHQEALVEFSHIIAFVDGHSSARYFNNPVNFHRYPIKFYLFADGVYLIDAADPYRHLIGARLVQVGQLTADEAVERLSPYIANDNPMTIQSQLPSWLTRPEALSALGIIDEETAPNYILELPGGNQQTFNPEMVTLAQYQASMTAPFNGLGSRAETLYLSRVDERYWFTYLEDSGTLFIQFNQVLGAISTLTDELEAFLDTQPVERVVLDVRLNGGGNNNRFPVLVNLLSAHPQINRPGRFFTIIGRQTFSAAANFVTELENRTHTIFVGEPIGGSPNLYGDASFIRLPNSGLQVSISTRYWQFSTPEDRRVWVAPDIPTPLTAVAYFADEDPALAAILSFDPADGLAPAYNPALEPLETDSWANTDLRDPYVVAADGTYYLFYAATGADGQISIGYATSRNGRKWFRASAEPTFRPSTAGFDQFGVTAPVVLLENGVWTLYYGALASADGRTTAVGMATADSPAGPWTRHPTPLLTVGPAGSWDSLAITPGSVIQTEGEWRLYYSGFSADQHIGIGMATSRDGLIWRKYDDPATSSAAHANSDPILAGAGAGAWDEIVWAPFVVVQDDSWILVYHGDPISNRNTLDIGIGWATSDDGINWTRPESPIMTLGDQDRFAHTPALQFIDGLPYLYYAAVLRDGTDGQIAWQILPSAN